MGDTMSTVTAHFVTFYSPGTFVAEQTRKPIDAWNIGDAMAMARDIVERHGATPFAFVFTTRSRGEDDLDSKEVNRSPTYYFGKRAVTLAEIESRNDPKDAILISNMKINKWERAVETMSGWRHASPLMEGDVVLDSEGRPC